MFQSILSLAFIGSFFGLMGYVAYVTCFPESSETDKENQ